jgi:TolB protein
MNYDGTGLKVLTNTNPFENTYPAWSPDGTQIVYTTGDENGGGLYVMNADGTDRRQVTSGDDIHAAWSPDGQKLVFTRRIPLSFNTQILVAPVGPGIAEPETLTTPANEYSVDLFPAWSPDGKQILFESNRSGKSSLYTMDIDGRNLHELPMNNPQGSFSPAWSPDGQQIVYTDISPSGTRQLFRSNLDGSHKVQLTNRGSLNTLAAWSPDGTMIAYLYYDGVDKATLYVINADGSNPRALLDKQCTILGSRPNWNPTN